MIYPAFMNPFDPQKTPVVFFDFDNTITARDVLDDMLVRFSINATWRGLEEKWKRGKISTLACLEGQIKGIRITKQDLDKWLSSVKLDPSFVDVIAFLESQKISVMVLSDNFDYIVKKIFRNHGITNLPVFANKVDFDEDRLIPHFPFRNKDCKVCAHCKRKTLLSNVIGGSLSIFIGDGLSDMCPAKCADIVFAKGNLLAYLRTHKITHTPFKTLKDVYRHLKGALAPVAYAQEAAANSR